MKGPERSLSEFSVFQLASASSLKNKNKQTNKQILKEKCLFHSLHHSFNITKTLHDLHELSALAYNVFRKVI